MGKSKARIPSPTYPINNTNHYQWEMPDTDLACPNTHYIGIITIVQNLSVYHNRWKMLKNTIICNQPSLYE